MKVLLIQSFSGQGIAPIFPIGLSYIAKAIEHHDVIGFDPNVEKDHLEKIQLLIKQFRPDVVGISLRTVWPFNEGTSMGPYYKETLVPLLRTVKHCGDHTIVIGGPGFTIYGSEIMEELPEIDYGVFREGEDTFPQLLEHLENPENVKGVFYRKQGKILMTGPKEMMHFNRLPMPKHGLFDLNQYKKSNGFIGVQTKRGCAWRCSYCVYPYICGNKIVLRPPDKTVDEIEYLYHAHGIRNIVFVDTVFNVPMEHAEALCHELLKRNLSIQWTAFFNPKHLTEEFAILAVKSGCYLFEFSPDAYSNKMLRLLQKDITKSDIIKTYHIIRKTDNGNARYNFFVNGPGENVLTFFQLLLFYLRAKWVLGAKLKQFYFGHLRIEPNTPLYHIALKEKRIDQNTRSIGSQEIYDRMIYRHSIFVDHLFKLLTGTKKILKFVLKHRSWV